MTCENEFCIYWANTSCTLKDINLDIQGSCVNCVSIELTKEFLAQKRKELRDKLDDRLLRMQEDGYPFWSEES